MKVVVAFAVALTLAVYSCAMAADDSANTSNNAKASSNANTSGTVNATGTVNTTGNTNTTTNTTGNTGATGNTNTTNNTNRTNNTNTTDNTNTTGNTNATNNTNTWNRPSTSGNSNTWNNATNNSNTRTNTGTPTNSNTWNNAGNWNNSTNRSGTWNNTNTATQEVLRVSTNGFAAIRAIRAARVAIFNGQPTVATNMLNQARVDLTAAAKDAPTFVAATEATVNGKVVADEVQVGRVNWIPIDGQVSLADTYTVSKEKNVHIKKANQYFQNGQSKQAIEELRLAAINVTCTRVMMPLTTTSNWVSQATKLIGQQKYYEANLALKAAEDGLVVNTTSMVEMPQVKTERVRQTN